MTLGLYIAWLRMRALKEVTLKMEPRGMRPRSSKRVIPWKATFSVMMFMSGKPRSSCAAAAQLPQQAALLESQHLESEQKAGV